MMTYSNIKFKFYQPYSFMFILHMILYFLQVQRILNYLLKKNVTIFTLKIESLFFTIVIVEEFLLN